MDALCDHLVLHLPPETNYNVSRPVRKLVCISVNLNVILSTIIKLLFPTSDEHVLYDAQKNETQTCEGIK